jgi:hypothetical protein
MDIGQFFQDALIVMVRDDNKSQAESFNTYALSPLIFIYAKSLWDINRKVPYYEASNQLIILQFAGKNFMQTRFLLKIIYRFCIFILVKQSA